MNVSMRINKVFWSNTARLEFYRLMAGLLKMETDIPEALEVVREACAARGAKSTTRVIDDLDQARLRGALQQTLVFYASGGERLLFSGIGSQDPASLFAGAADILEGRSKMSRAIKSALVMPTLLLGLIGVLGVMLHLQVFPAFAQIMDPGDFPPTARILASSLEWMADWGSFLGVGAVAAVLIILGSLPLYAEPGRRLLDKVFPWNLYKLNLAIGFYLAIAALIKSGRDFTLRELGTIAGSMPRYGQRNIAAIIDQSAELKLEDRILAAGKVWPDQELNAVFRAFNSKSGGAPLFSAYLDSWIQSAEARIKAHAATLNTVLLIAISALIMLGMFAMFQFFQTIS